MRTIQQRILHYVRTSANKATHAELRAGLRLQAQQLDFALLGLLKDKRLERSLGVYQVPDRRPPAPIKWDTEKRGAKEPKKERFCTRCADVLPIDRFYKTDTRCKCCRKKIAREAYEAKRAAKRIVTALLHDASSP